MLHEIWQADTRKSADKALDRFVATYEAKYPKAVDCMVRDREILFASSMALMKDESAGKPLDSGQPYTRFDSSSPRANPENTE